MNWLFLNPIKGRDWGGMENWMVKLCQTLPEQGDRCLLAGRPRSRWPDVCRQSAIPYAPFSYGFDLAPWAVLRLRQICRDFRPDVVVAKGFRAARFARLAWPSAAVAVKCPFPQDLKDTSIDRLTLNTCIDRVLTDNLEARTRMLALPWILPGKIAAIHNGVLHPPHPRSAGFRTALGERFAIPPDAIVVGAAGRLEPHKNYAHAIEAFAQVANNHPHAQLLIFGDGPCQPELSGQIERLGLNGRVRLQGWHDNTRELLWGCDIVMHPSGSEGLPNVVLEAMAGGIPVIATDAGGTREILTDAGVGCLTPVGDIGALARALHELIGNPERRSTMGDAAAEHVRTQFSIEHMAVSIRRVMTEAVQLRYRLRQAVAPRLPHTRELRSPDMLDKLGAVWERYPEATLVSNAPHTIVHRMDLASHTYYLKKFLNAPCSLRGLGLRRTQAERNFRLAAALQLRGATVVPHLAAVWKSHALKAGESILLTEAIPGSASLDQHIVSYGRAPVRTQRTLTVALASWLAHLHAAGIACHDLKAGNILSGTQSAHDPGFALLDLDNGRLRPIAAHAHDIERNLHQCFRSFQAVLRRGDVRRFLAVYRRTSGIDRNRFARLCVEVERRLHRRGTGYAELGRKSGIGSRAP